jgi:serine protease Do
MKRYSHWFASLAAVAALHTAAFAQEKTDAPKKAEEPKPAVDPKDVRVGPPPELAELRKAVEDAARKGENVDEIRKQLESLEKALAGKAWVRPKPVEEPAEPPRRGARDVVPQPVPLPGVELRMAENLQKAQELMLRAALLRGDDPAEAEKLMRKAAELMGVNRGGGLLLPPRIDVFPALPGRGSRLGVRVEEVPEAMIERFELPKDNGILAAEIVPDSAAEKAGLKAGDVIVEFAGKPVGTDPTRFVRTVQGMKPGEKVDIVYYRKGKKEEAKGIQLSDLEPRRDFEAPRNPPAPPRVVPLPGFDPDLNPRGANKSLNVQVTNGKAVIEAVEDGVKVSIEGTVADGKVTPTKIAVTEGRKTVDAESIEKLPAEHRDRVKRILGEVKVK